MSALGVTLCAIPLVLRAHVVDHIPQVVVGALVVVVGVCQECLRQLQDYGHEHEQLARDLVEEFAVETGDFGVVFFYDFVAGEIGPVGSVFGDVELYGISYIDKCTG